MSEDHAPPLRKQVDDKVIDACNEIIMQATNTFLLGRQVVLVSLGLTVLGVEQIQALLQQAVERGDVLESDAQRMIDTQWRQLAEGTTANISSRLAALLNKVPGVSIAYTVEPGDKKEGQPRPMPTLRTRLTPSGGPM